MKTIFLSFSIKNSSLSEYFIELANRLSVRHKVIIISYGSQKHGFRISERVEVLEWPSRRPTKFKDFLFLVKMVRDQKPEFMIANFGAVNLFLIVGYLFKVPHRISWYRTLYGQLQGNFWLKLRKKLIYKLATDLVANSTATKDDLIENFGVKEEKIKVFHNAVRDYNIVPREVQKNKILYVGRMDPIKGVHVLIDAIPLILKDFPDLDFIFIGGDVNGKEINAYKEKADAIGIREKVNFVGNIGKPGLLQELSTAYVTIVPSIKEAFGYVVIESFSVKTPVIGSNTTGIAEIIRDHKDGLLFEPGNSSDLAKKVLNLMNNPSIRDDYSRNCYQRFMDGFELEAATQVFISSVIFTNDENK